MGPEIRQGGNQMCEVCGSWAHEKFSVGGLKMEGAMWQGMRGASKNGGEPGSHH